MTNLADPDITVVREIPCSACSRRRPNERGTGRLRYKGGRYAGKIAECIGCDGTGYEYEALVIATMELDI